MSNGSLLIYHRRMSTERIKARALEIGFDLVGISEARPTLEAAFYPEWIELGFAGNMSYLKGRRGDMRSDPRSLLPSANSVISVGIVYNTQHPYSTDVDFNGQGWVSRYAWGEDYHHVLKRRLQALVDILHKDLGAFETKICVDTAPLLERAYAHRSGLGWIGHNTCLINQQLGSWLFLGEVLTSLSLECDNPAAFRCGSCTRCIEACPTDALVPTGELEGPAYALDSNKCISYWSIELKGSLPESARAMMGEHLFGCDICQDVCPWNRRAAVTEADEFQPRNALPNLEEVASMTPEEFDRCFGDTPVERTRYRGFLRNVAVAMGNSGKEQFLELLYRMTDSPDPVIVEHALWAIDTLKDKIAVSKS